MLRRSDRLLDLAFHGLVTTFLACAAVLVATLVVEVLHGGELGPAVPARQAATSSVFSR